MAEKLPPGFEMCSDQSCPDLKDPIKDDELKFNGEPKKKCKSPPCRCRFFERPSNMGADHPWWFVFPDEKGKYIAKGRYDYQAFCVKPALPKGPEGKHYVACSSEGCKLDSEMDGTNKKVWCAAPKNACSKGCDCVLFRLKRETPKPDNPQVEKWEFVAKADDKVDYDKNYHYECICVKLEDDD